MPELTVIGGERTLLVSREDMRERYQEVLSHSYQDEEEPPVLVLDGREVVANGMFSDRQIRVGLAIGHIVCDPYPTLINPSSIDLTLGHYFYHAGDPETYDTLFNPFDENDTYRYFNVNRLKEGHKEAKPWGEVKAKLGKKAFDNFGDLQYIPGIPEEHPMILLRPGERILAHTQEFVGILPPGTSQMQNRSTNGRIGLSACYCAGWGDPGYINRWTMEVHNLNENEFLPVPVGYRLPQLIFAATGPVGLEYSRASGNYQATTSGDLATIKRNWRPHMMLPRAFYNAVILPTPVAGLSAGLK